VIDAGGAHATPRYDMSENNIYAHLVYSAKAADTRHVIINGRVVMRDRQITTIDEEAVLAQARKRAMRISHFVVDREHNVLDKLITLGGIAQEETFEVQMKARIENAEAIDALLKASDEFEIIKHSVREQYDTYLMFADPGAGRLRYREDHVKVDNNVQDGVWNANPRIAPEYRLTLVGQAVEHEYENSAILTRSRYDAPAVHSLRFYREYFQPVRTKEVSKQRTRYRVIFRDLEFSVNLDRLTQPAYPDMFLEIKSRTWSAKDAYHKAEVISDLLERLGGTAGAIMRGEYVTF